MQTPRWTYPIDLVQSMAFGFAWASGLLAVFLCVLFIDRMGVFQSKNKFPVDGRVRYLMIFANLRWLTY